MLAISAAPAVAGNPRWSGLLIGTQYYDAMRKPAFFHHHGWSIGLSSIFLAGLVTMQADQARPAPAASQNPVPAPAVPIPLSRVKPDATIAVATGFSMTVTTDGVWVTDRAKQTITRIDPKTNAPAATIALDGPPCGAALAAFKTLWVAICGRETIARVSFPPAPSATPSPAPATTPPPAPAATSASTPLPSEKPTASTPAPPTATALPAPGKPITIQTPGGAAGMLATGAGSVWSVIAPTGTIARIDPDTNAVVAEVSVLAGANAMTFANDALWLASTPKGVVTRVNGHTNVVTKTITVGKSPVAVAAGAGSLWVLNAGDGTVSRLDPATDKVTETIKLGTAGPGSQTGAILFAEGSLWVSVPGTPLARIDPASNRVVQRFTGTGGGTLAAGLRSLWLAVSPTELWRVDPKRVEATR
jgi:virginiamycin B lyase